jgi:DNA-binding NarL/FixJ family response regulator
VSAETPSQRRDRRRAEQSGLTDEQNAHREDEQFERSANTIRSYEMADKARAEITRQRGEADLAKASRPTEKAKSKRIREADARARRVQRMHAHGISQKQIAAKLEWDVSTVRRLLKRPV